ncbi:putative inactive purple acid phosphatase 2 [Wolffia australiana]
MAGHVIVFFAVLCFGSGALSATLSVSPNSISKSGDKVKIQWSGVNSPSDRDWLGIYSPPDSPDDTFIGYLFLSSAPGWQSGSGEFDLRLINLRSDYAFRIFRWSSDEVDPKRHDHEGSPLPGTRHRLASSDFVRFRSPAAPEQIHLSFADGDDEMRVVFVAGDDGERFVRFGEEGRLDRTVRTDVARYDRTDMCGSPANTSRGWRDPGFVHDAVMRDLKKGTRYFYQVGSDAKGWSTTLNFTSRHSQSNETYAILFGDMGTWAPYNTFRRQQQESKSTIKWILRDLQTLDNKPCFVSHIGDISYARGYSWIWDEFFNQIEPVAAHVPYHVAIGNHEYDWPTQPWRPTWSVSSYGTDGGGECGVPYSLRFRMPGNSSLPTGTRAPDTRNLYYSFDSGPVHFLYISTETNFLPGSDQHNFIKKDLEGLDRKKTPFVIVQGHRPMYTTSNEVRDAPLRTKFLESLEPLLVGNNVTLALWGHVHRYERFCPLKNFTCVDWSRDNATVHLVIGMGGQDWQPIWEPWQDHPDKPVFPQPERSMYRGGEFGYTRLYATKEKLRLEYVGNHDGQVHDSLEILSGYGDGHGDDHDLDGGKREVVLGHPLGIYVEAAGVLFLGSLLGFILGFVVRRRRESDAGNSWVPVRSEES